MLDRSYLPLELAKVLTPPAQLQYLIQQRRKTQTPQALYPDWRTFLYSTFPKLKLKSFAPFHVELWDWAWAIQPNERPLPFVALWSRGAAKSSTAEMIAAMIGITRKRPYIIYVSGTQDQADKHVSSMATLLEHAGIARAVNKYGSSKGWRRDRLHAQDFTIDALGLDTASRGIRVDDNRPGFMVLDDIDNRHDKPETTKKNIETLTDTVLMAGANDCAVLFVQNLISQNSIASRLHDGRADFLLDRIVSGPYPALNNFKYDIMAGKIQISGEPTWEGQTVEDCYGIIKTSGWGAFKRECQHLVNESENGVWRREFIAANRVIQHPALERIVIGVDPPGSTSTECGIVANGLQTLPDKTKHLYTLEDASKTGTPDEWGRAVVTLFYKLQADLIVAEVNFGGDMVASVIHNVDRNVPVEMVNASRGKAVRAEPIATLCQNGQEHHVGTFELLEDEQCTWIPGMPSPNRMDAHVWSATELIYPKNKTWVPVAKKK